MSEIAKKKTKTKKKEKEKEEKDKKDDPLRVTEITISLDTVLQETKEIFEQKDLSKRNGALQKFENKYREALAKASRKSDNKKDGNFLHILADSKDWTPEGLKVFVHWILDKYPKLLEVVQDKTRFNSMHAALFSENHAFVEAILGKANLKSLESILMQRCQYGNCLDHAIQRSSPLIGLMVTSCKLRPSLFKPVSGNNSALHWAVKKVSRYDIEKILCMSQEGPQGVTAKFAESGYQNDNCEYVDLKPSHQMSLSPEEASRKTAVDWRQGSGQVVSQLEIVQLLITAHSDALEYKNDRNMTPYQMREHWIRSSKPLHKALYRHLYSKTQDADSEDEDPDLEDEDPDTEDEDPNIQDEDPDTKSEDPNVEDENSDFEGKVFGSEEENAKSEDDDSDANHKSLELQEGNVYFEDIPETIIRKVVIDDPISSFIRYYSIREFPRNKIVKCLYQPGQERHIEFDLAGLPNPTISSAYLDRLAKHLQFESILKYVALPKLTIESNKRSGQAQIHPKGLRDLTVIFDWLRKNHVRKIIKIMVIDEDHPSHSDAAIEEALNGFDVEEWDWKRLDLCSEVIVNSTKVVRDISLCSTGNNAVLMGWSSAEGFRDIRKFPELKVINLFIREGQEDSTRLLQYIQLFKENLEACIRPTGECIQVNWCIDNEAVSYAATFQTSKGVMQPDNPWINCMKSFATFIRTIPDEVVAPIKNAVIDDGVDAALDILNGKIAGGSSFCPYPNSTDLMSAYFVPSGTHGTRMATLICQICPKCRIYVARLEEHYTIGGRRQITAKSAAEAIDWAIACEVDIISMSWTIETNDTLNPGMKALSSAISAAEEKIILMFCSASDQGSASIEKCFPGQWEKCIKIGAATATGDKLPWVYGESIDFQLPGENILFMNNDGIAPSYLSGSSVATAAASGFGGLLLYCNRLVDAGDEDQFRQRDLMKDAFKTLSKSKKFPCVQIYFEKKFKDYIIAARQASVKPEKSEARQFLVKIEDLTWDIEEEILRKALSSLMELIKVRWPNTPPWGTAAEVRLIAMNKTVWR